MTEQLSLFTIHPVQVSQPKIDPYWDEITGATVKVGDRVKLSPDWMNKCADATAGKYKADYQFTSEDELICKVIAVDPRNNGNIHVDRNGYGLFVPAGNFTSVEQGDSVEPLTSSLINEYRQEELGSLLCPTLFTEENVREQDTSKYPTRRNQAGLGTITDAPEHFGTDSQPANFAPEHTHWIAEYWVKRGNKKHYYWRYYWMEGRKLKRLHLGSVSSPVAQAKREEIEIAIAVGKSPADIKQMLKP